MSAPESDAQKEPARGRGGRRDVAMKNGTALPRRPLIIERPDLQTLAQRYGNMTVTFFAWFMWLYLVVPLLSVFAWAAGFQIIYDTMIQDMLTADLFKILKRYGTGAGIFAGIYLLWAITSFLRWRNVERRRPATPVPDRNLADSHHLAINQLNALRQAQRQVLSIELMDQMFAPFDEDELDPAPHLSKKVGSDTSD